MITSSRFGIFASHASFVIIGVSAGFLVCSSPKVAENDIIDFNVEFPYGTPLYSMLRKGKSPHASNLAFGSISSTQIHGEPAKIVILSNSGQSSSKHSAHIEKSYYLKCPGVETPYLVFVGQPITEKSGFLSLFGKDTTLRNEAEIEALFSLTQEEACSHLHSLMENDSEHKSPNCCRIVSKLGKSDSLALLKAYQRNFQGIDFDDSQDTNIKLDEDNADHHASDLKAAAQNTSEHDQHNNQHVEMTDDVHIEKFERPSIRQSSGTRDSHGTHAQARKHSRYTTSKANPSVIPETHPLPVQPSEDGLNGGIEFADDKVGDVWKDDQERAKEQELKDDAHASSDKEIMLSLVKDVFKDGLSAVLEAVEKEEEEDDEEDV